MSENWEKIGTGAILEDKFRIIKNLDPGGGGPVFSAILIRSNSILHLRFFSDKEIPDLKIFNDCLIKAKKAFSVSRDTVTLPFDYGFYKGIPYVAYAVSNLRTMHQFFQSGEKLGIQEARRIIEALIVTLKKVHPVGVYHLGLSPISIHQREGGFVASGLGIIDFGLTGERGHDYYTRPSNDPRFLNIAGYASPEQAALSDEIDHRSDLYSIGAIIYRILVGRDPFTGRSPGDILVKVMSEMPEGIEDGKELWPAMRKFLVRALQKDPEDRFESAAAMLEAYGKALASGSEAVARAPKQEERVAPPAAPKEEKKEPKKTAAWPPPLPEAKAPKPPPGPARMEEKRVEKKAEVKLGIKLSDLAAERPEKGVKPEPAAIKDLLPEPFEGKGVPAKPAQAAPAEARKPAVSRPLPHKEPLEERAADHAVERAARPVIPMLLAEGKEVWKKLPARLGTLARSGLMQAQRSLLAFGTFLRLLWERTASAAGRLPTRISRAKIWKHLSRIVEIKNLFPARTRAWIGPALIVLVVAAAGVIAFLVFRGPGESHGQKGKSSGLQQQAPPEKPRAENPEGIEPPAAHEKIQGGQAKGETDQEMKAPASQMPSKHPPALPEKKGPKEETKPPLPKEAVEKEKKIEKPALVPEAGSVEAKTKKGSGAEEEKKSMPEVKAEEEKVPEARPKKKKRKKVDLSGLKILD